MWDDMGIQKDKLTNGQKVEIERLRQFVARNRLDARMNGTKWRAAIDAVAGIEGYVPSFRVKAVTDAEEPSAAVWDAAFPGNIPLYNSIEWLELCPGNPAGGAAAGGPERAGSAGSAGDPSWSGGKGKRADFREALKRALTAAGIPIEESAGGIRIIGFTRNGSGRK
jgi:uncharacterized protein DUF6678